MGGYHNLDNEEVENMESYRVKFLIIPEIKEEKKESMLFNTEKRRNILRIKG